jgi:long-chain acyl-CoA synthetase
MKMVRGKITERFKKEIDYLYSPEAKEIKNRMNIHALQIWNS